MIFSCIIPASKKDAESQMLKDLIKSIRDQDFDQSQVEILVITEGDSEQAKAIGIRRAKGEICAMFCADNELMERRVFKVVKDTFDQFSDISAIFSRTYYYSKDDNSLNRYFSLIGGNDPICYYLGKNDRRPRWYELKVKSNYPPSYGCNGFFYRSDLIKNTNLDHYYPMDNAMEVPGRFMPMLSGSLWHKTSDNLLTFLKKRYKYARDLYCNRSDRRWKMVDTREDHIRLFFFVLGSITFIQPLMVSIRGFGKIRDWAWFWHPIVCFGFTVTYGVLTLRTFWSRLLSRRWDALNPLKPA